MRVMHEPRKFQAILSVSFPIRQRDLVQGVLAEETLVTPLPGPMAKIRNMIVASVFSPITI